MSLLKLLSKEGYDATGAKSGREAIERVKEIDFDLLIVDVRMPEMDEIEMIKEIRNYLKGVHNSISFFITTRI